MCWRYKKQSIEETVQSNENGREHGSEESSDYGVQVLALAGVFVFCWAPYAGLSLAGIFGQAKVRI